MKRRKNSNQDEIVKNAIKIIQEHKSWFANRENRKVKIRENESLFNGFDVLNATSISDKAKILKEMEMIQQMKKKAQFKDENITEKEKNMKN